MGGLTSRNKETAWQAIQGARQDGEKVSVIGRGCVRLPVVDREGRIDGDLASGFSTRPSGRGSQGIIRVQSWLMIRRAPEHKADGHDGTV